MPVCDAGHNIGRRDSQCRSKQSAHEGQGDRLHQELLEDVSPRGSDRDPQADLTVRSRTETSMMFMIPTPPLSSETEAMAARSIESTLDDVA